MHTTIDILSVLSDTSRLAVIKKIWQGGEHCVCELMEIIGKSQSTTSRHMMALKKIGLVLDRRDAQWVRYRRNPKLSKHTDKLIKQIIEHDKK